MDVDESTPSESALDQQIREIENQVAHLVRSNAEIKEILETEGGDKELRTAIVRVACPPASPCYAHRTFSSHVFPSARCRARISSQSLDDGPFSRICTGACHSQRRRHLRQTLASACDAWLYRGLPHSQTVESLMRPCSSADAAADGAVSSGCARQERARYPYQPRGSVSGMLSCSARARVEADADL